MLAANGLLIHPQGYSGCCCSYNYKTNLALISAPGAGDTWYVLPGRASRGPIKHLAINFGAPGDRKDASGAAWLGYPRPMLDTACPAPVTVSMQQAACTYRRRATAEIENTGTPWVCSSALSGAGRIAIDLALQPELALPRRDTSPEVDGRLEDSCWKDVRVIPFQNTPFSMLGTAVEFRMFRDDNNIYIAYHCPSTTDTQPEPQATEGPEDRLEIYLADAGRGKGVHLVIPRDTKAAATFGTVGTGRKVDPAWKGRWHSAVQEVVDGWTAEVALPVATLTDLGMDLRRLQINCMAQRRTSSGLEAVFLTDPRYGTKFRSCVGFRRIGGDPVKRPTTRIFTVRLHFAETEDAGPGERVFDVAVQGKTIREGFDVSREAGGWNRAVVEELRHVAATDQIVIDLTPSAQATDGNLPPVISGVEIIEEE